MHSLKITGHTEIDQIRVKITKKILDLKCIENGEHGDSLCGADVEKVIGEVRSFLYDEEAWLDEIGCPDCDAHKDLHAMLIHEMEALCREWTQGRRGSISCDLEKAFFNHHDLDDFFANVFIELATASKRK